MSREVVAIHSLMLSFTIACSVTTLGLLDFIKSPQTVKYLASNIIFLNFIQPTLPAVFPDNPFPALNGALWTIKIEVMLYFCIPLIFLAFQRFGSIRSTFAIYLGSITYVYFCINLIDGDRGLEIVRQFPGQLSYFTMGSLFAINERIFSKVRFIAIPAICALYIVDNPMVKIILNPILYSSIVIYLSTSAIKNMNFGKYGDLSYGIYLYHFPIIQLLIFLGIYEANIYLGLFLTLTLTIFTAVASWHLIERPLLKRSSHYVLAAEQKP